MVPDGPAPRVSAASLLAIAATVACGDGIRGAPAAPQIVAIENSLPEGSAQSGLSTTPDGRIYLCHLCTKCLQDDVSPPGVGEVRDERVGVMLTKSGGAVVSWIERRGKTAVLRVKRVSPSGNASRAIDGAMLGNDKRAGGQAERVAVGDEALLAWADAAAKRVRTVEVKP